MSKSRDEIVVGANGSIFSAPIGTALPSRLSEPFGVGWTELGYVTEDGVTWTDGKSMNAIRAWQSFYDLRRVVESREGTAAFSLMQWNGENVKLAYGGGDIVEDAPGEYRYVPPAPSDTGETMLGIEWEDGSKDYRLVLPAGNTTDNVETNVTRTDAALLPITFAILGEDGRDPWYFQTNDPAFAAVAGSGS